MADCDILIIDEPTVGIDTGAKEYMHDLIWRIARDQGKSIILISSDMPALMSFARRVLVFMNCRIVGELADLNVAERDLDRTAMRIGQFPA